MTTKKYLLTWAENWYVRITHPLPLHLKVQTICWCSETTTSRPVNIAILSEATHQNRHTWGTRDTGYQSGHKCKIMKHKPQMHALTHAEIIIIITIRRQSNHLPQVSSFWSRKGAYWSQPLSFPHVKCTLPILCSSWIFEQDINLHPPPPLPTANYVATWLHFYLLSRKQIKVLPPTVLNVQS